MKYFFTIHPKAREEVLHSINYLDQQQTGYGDIFNLRVDEAIAKIISNPTRYQEVIRGKGRYRMILEKPFHKSYCIYYDFDGEMVRIISIFHNSRSDLIWKERE